MLILFRCVECNELVAWPEDRSDGNRCGCGGYLKPIDKGTQKELRNKHPLYAIEFMGNGKEVERMQFNSVEQTFKDQVSKLGSLQEELLKSESRFDYVKEICLLSETISRLCTTTITM